MIFRKASWAASFALVVAVLASFVAAGVTTMVFRSGRASASGGSLTPVSAGRYVGVASSNLVGFDQSTGIRANVTLRYLAWGTHLPTNYIVSARSRGATTMIELLPYTISLTAIADGRGDAYLQQLGTEIADTHDDVLMA
jgi:hypothetical protein